MSLPTVKPNSALCHTLVAIASETYRPDPACNQDAAAIIKLPQATLMTIADGMGSFSDAGDAARFCTRTLHDQLASLMADWQERYHPNALFSWLRSGLHRYATEQRAGTPALSLEKAYGTTLILGGETANELGFSYVGNGGVFRLPGNFWLFPDEVALPWCWVNLLNPHSQWENGQEALYRYVSPTSTEPMVSPTSLRLSKDAHFGDILILVTDGIYSSDQALVGNANGTLWMQVEARLIALHRALRSLFYSAEPLTQRGLERTLQAYLAEIKAEGLIEDDATLGVLITASAQEYHARTQRGVATGEEKV